MRILPVLDLLNGLVVRGVAGRRATYRPVVSRLVASADPVAVAAAFRSQFGLSELYVADIDAITGADPALPTLRALRRHGLRLWVDAGVHDLERADVLAAEGMNVVVGLETVAGPAALAAVTDAHGDATVFSLDLRDGIPLGDRSAWDGADAFAIAERAVALGAVRLLVLDLARVGIGSGTGTGALCQRLVASFPGHEVWVGGGVRNADDLRRLQGLGVRAVLVASALHDGSITRADLDGLPADSAPGQLCS